MTRWLLPLAVLLLVAAPDLGRASPEVTFAPYEDPEARALELLDRAQTSLDVAQYNIRNERFVAKLREVRDRGVRVRVVVDAKNARNPWNTVADELEADGFAVLRYENTRSAFASMHHKFTVVDDALVMTGSYNWNETAQLVNEENMLVLRDPGLVAAYRAEFAWLWTGAAAPGAAGVGGGQDARVLFAPRARPRDAVVEAVRAARRRVLVAVFSFKDTVVARELRDAARRGVEVILVTERKQADTTGADETVATGGARVIVGANTSAAHSAMHHKFAVIDDELVIAGASNWTYTAFFDSNEDLLFLRDPALAARYTVAFGALVRRYDPAGFDAAAFGIRRPEAGAHFVVAMPRVGPHESVWITGDHPALGSWSPDAGLELRTSESMHPIWGGRVALPAGAQIRWKAVVRPSSAHAARLATSPALPVALAALGWSANRWELGADRVLETDPAGTDGVFAAEFRDLVEVTLSARLPATLAAALAPGSTLRLVGGHPALGGWDPALGLPLEPQPALPGVFAATASLPGNAWIDCKLVLVAADGSSRWESGWNRWLPVWSRDAPQAIELGAFRD